MMKFQYELKLLQQQIARFERQEKSFREKNSQLSWLRLFIFLGGVFFLVLSYLTANILWSYGTLALLLVFIVLVIVHKKFKESLLKREIYLDFLGQQLARIQLDWSKLAVPFASHFDQHPLSRDLNLTGQYSLHHLIDLSTSHEGCEGLKKWLVEPSTDQTEILQKQQLIKELIKKSRFRNQFILTVPYNQYLFYGHKKKLKWKITDFIKWFEQTADSNQIQKVLYLLGSLSLINLSLGGLYLLKVLPQMTSSIFIVYILVSLYFKKHIASLFDEVISMSYELAKLQDLFLVLENYSSNHSPHLKQLLKPFHDRLNKPSKHIKKLNWVVSAISLRNNFILWGVINALVPWDFFFAWYLSRYKKTLSTKVAEWLQVVVELEGYISLANFAALHPEYKFPEIQETVTEQPLSCTQIGHPLIPPAQRVTNSFQINHLGEVNIITGSNMAGKSTFLRTLGLNLCLTFAGGPVCAESLTTSPFRIMTCIKVSDSLQDGLSYFYAEVTRLKELLDNLYAKEPIPLFFLVDEIFRGTNNKERLIGSRSYIEALVNQNGVGLISTHDLELVHLADQFPEIKNYHFKETIQDSKMVFDYLLSHGPSPTTNALKVMKLAGLPVNLQEE